MNFKASVQFHFNFIMEIEIGMTMRCHYTPMRMARIHDPGNTRVWRGCEATGALIMAGANVRWHKYSGGQIGRFIQN